MGLGNQDHLRSTPIRKSGVLNASGQRSKNFVLGKIRTESAIRIRESATDIALETGAARHELWQHGWWCQEHTHQVIGICRHKKVPVDAQPILTPFDKRAQGDVTFNRFSLATAPLWLFLARVLRPCVFPRLEPMRHPLTLSLPLYAHKAHVTVLLLRMRVFLSHEYCLDLTCLPPTSYTAAE
jgi:hypothetical protein